MNQGDYNRQDKFRISVRNLGKHKPPSGDVVYYDHESHDGADYSNRNWAVFNSHGCRFSNCSFINAKIVAGCLGCGFAMSTYTDCIFDGCQIKNINPGNTRFERCSFRNVLLRSLLFLVQNLLSVYFLVHFAKLCLTEVCHWMNVITMVAVAMISEITIFLMRN